MEKFRQELLESSSELAPLKVWQFQELSLQAAQRILTAPKEEVLNVMTFIAQNFPTQVWIMFNFFFYLSFLFNLIKKIIYLF